jgi:Kdo2-lipid IVA lauroyltransferase/acyltransferase
LLPRRLLGALGANLGALAYALGIRRGVVRANLSLAFPEKTQKERDSIAWANYQHAGRSVLEVFAASRLAPTEVDGLLEYRGFELFERLFAEKRGVVVASAHLGAWELLASACGRRGIPMNLVTRALRGQSNAALQRARKRSGITEIPPKGALATGAAALRRGEVVVNLIDQNMLPKRGVFVRFFGAWACTTPATTLLAMRSGAPVIVAVAVNLPDGRTRLCVEGPFPLPTLGSVSHRVRAHTQTLVAVVERYVRAEPTQWFWLHRRWKTRPKAPPGEITL